MSKNIYVGDKCYSLNYIVFLDIDGVMNSIHTKSSDYFTKESIETLNYLYEKYSIQIVISSSWKETFPLYYLQELFCNKGVLAPIIDKTDTYFEKNVKRCSFSLEELETMDTDIHYHRCYEIMNWIKRYSIEKYVIIDDWSFKDTPIEKHSILTHYYGNKEDILGLNKEHIELIEEIFSL